MRCSGYWLFVMLTGAGCIGVVDGDIDALSPNGGGDPAGSTGDNEQEPGSDVLVAAVAHARRTDVPPFIDGSADDWDGHAYAVGPSTIARTAGRNWGVAGDSDLSGFFSLLWDDTALYFVVQATDNTSDTQLADTTQWFTADGVAVFFDLDADHSGTQYREGDSSLAFVSSGTKTRVYFRRGDESGGETLQTPGGVQAILTRQGSSWTVEARIPWEVLLDNNQGRVVPQPGFTVLLLDGEEGTAAAKQVMWVGTGDDQSTWGTLVLDGYVDADGDGWPRFTDCADAVFADHPGAADVPGDGRDNDCNGKIDDAVQLPARLVGYGVVESWRLIDATRLADLLVENGLNMTEIEYVGDDPGGQGLWSSINHAATKSFVQTMRSRGIWTWINIVNWNGPDQRARSDAEFQAELSFIIQEIGIDHVILQAASEWDDSEGGRARRWANMVATQWKGAKSWNEGSRPSSGPDDHLLDWHPCSVGDLPPTDQAPASRFIVNTDCGRTIEDLDADRGRIPGYVEQALRFGGHFHYYEAVGPDPNDIQSDVIERIGEGKRAAGL